MNKGTDQEIAAVEDWGIRRRVASDNQKYVSEIERAVERIANELLKIAWVCPPGANRDCPDKVGGCVACWVRWAVDGDETKEVEG